MSDGIDSLQEDIERLKAEALKERDDLSGDFDDDSINKNNDDDGNSDSNNDSSDDDGNDSEDNSGYNSKDDSNESESKEEKSSSSNSDENSSESTGDLTFKPIKTKVNGHEISLDTPEEVSKFISNKNSNFVDNRKSISEEIVSQANLSDSDLKLLADIKAGNIGALNKLAKESKIDLVDVDEFKGDYETQFEPKVLSDVDVVINNISSNKELSAKFNDVIGDLPDDFLSSISDSANDLATFANHVNSGMAQDLIPLASKAAALNGGSLLENYIRIGEEKYSSQSKKNNESSSNNSNDSKNLKRDISDREKDLRKRASADFDANKGGKSSDLSVDDIWEMSEDEISKLNLRDLA